MKSIRPRARDSIDDSACGPAVLGRIVTAQHGNLLNRVDTKIVTQHTAWSSVRVVVDAHPIKTIVVLIRPCAGNAQGRSKTALGVASALGASRLDARDTRLKGRELGPITPIKRRVAHGRGTDVTPNRRRSLIRGSPGNSHPNDLARISRLHHNIEDQAGSDVYRDIGSDLSREAQSRNRNLIASRQQVRCCVQTRGIRRDRTRNPCRQVGQRDSHVGYSSL